MCFRVTDTAKSVDEVVSRETSAGTDSWVPNFVDFARRVADAIGGVIGGEWGTDAATVSNEIVSSFAETLAVGIGFIGVAGRGAQS